MLEKTVQQMFYKKAKAAEDLPWHSATPARLLIDAVAQRAKPGIALDLGCGTGVFSAFLAKNGYRVTRLDFIPRALEMASERAGRERIEVQWVLANLLEWNSDRQFDLILDSGCLHTIRGRDMNKYKKKLLDWLAPDGDYVLAHWGKRHALDWRSVGPRRRTRTALAGFFSPELYEKAHTDELLTGVPLPIGPAVLGQCFWFKRSRSGLTASAT